MAERRIAGGLRLLGHEERSSKAEQSLKNMQRFGAAISS
jgi:hypothetical protein